MLNITVTIKNVHVPFRLDLYVVPCLLSFLEEIQNKKTIKILSSQGQSTVKNPTGETS